MSTELVFMMGAYEARFPTDRFYTRNHLWLKPTAEGADVYRAGFTAYSVRLLRDVYFLDWHVEPGTAVAARQEIGEVESSKAVSSLYAPCAGILVALNEALLEDPSAINLDNYGNGWLFELTTAEPLLSPDDYVKHLGNTWESTQRMIAKQVKST